MTRLKISWHTIATLFTGLLYLITGIFVVRNLIATNLKLAFFTRALNSSFQASFLVIFLHCDFHFFLTKITCDVFHAHSTSFLVIGDFSNSNQLITTNALHTFKLTVFIVVCDHVIWNFTTTAERDISTFKN